MRQDYTDITLILDESGSMGPIASDTIGSVNRFIADHAAEPGFATFTLVTFNTANMVPIEASPISDVKPISAETYRPGGGTALLDAIGDTIERAGKRFEAMSEHHRPAKVLVAILTDGEENSSRRFSNQKIKEMIEHQDKTYSWDFIFMGANQDSFSTAGNLGIPQGNVMDFDATEEGVKVAFCAASAGGVSYRSGNTTRGNYFG